MTRPCDCNPLRLPALVLAYPSMTITSSQILTNLNSLHVLLFILDGHMEPVVKQHFKPAAENCDTSVLCDVQTYSTQAEQGTNPLIGLDMLCNLNQICKKFCEKRIVNTILVSIHLGVNFLLK